MSMMLFMLVREVGEGVADDKQEQHRSEASKCNTDAGNLLQQQSLFPRARLEAPELIGERLLDLLGRLNGTEGGFATWCNAMKESATGTLGLAVLFANAEAAREDDTPQWQEAPRGTPAMLFKG